MVMYYCMIIITITLASYHNDVESSRLSYIKVQKSRPLVALQQRPEGTRWIFHGFGGFHGHGGTPKTLDGLCHGKSHLEMDDD